MGEIFFLSERVPQILSGIEKNQQTITSSQQQPQKKTAQQTPPELKQQFRGFLLGLELA